MEFCNFYKAPIWTLFSLKLFKLGWVAFQSIAFQLECLDFQSNQYEKLVPVLSRFCSGLHVHVCKNKPIAVIGVEPAVKYSFV